MEQANEVSIGQFVTKMKSVLDLDVSMIFPFSAKIVETIPVTHDQTVGSLTTYHCQVQRLAF